MLWMDFAHSFRHIQSAIILATEVQDHGQRSSNDRRERVHAMRFLRYRYGLFRPAMDIKNSPNQ